MSHRPLSQYFHSFKGENGKSVPQLRTTYKALGKCIELHFQSRAFPISLSRDNASPFLSDRLKLDPVLKVPGDDEKTFKKLLSFFETGEYKSSGFKGEPHSSSSSRLGPPAIVEFDASSKASLLIDIKMYRLGMDLDLKELKVLALRCLFNQYQTNEDPCVALEYIYHAGPVEETKEGAKKTVVKRPDTALREWVKAWLKVPCGPPFFDNLGILQKHPLWTEKYSKLRERGSELVTDTDSVEMELAQQRASRYRSHAAQKLISRSYDSIPQVYPYRQRDFRPDNVQQMPVSPRDAPVIYDFPPHHVYGHGRSRDDFDLVQYPNASLWPQGPDPTMDATAKFFPPNENDILY